jgi:hypothetical protein
MAAPKNEDEETEALHEEQQRSVALVRKLLNPRLERAELAYGQAVRSLWLGNAGAALATLSFIGAAWKGAPSLRILLVPFGFFVFGLIAMGIGEVASIWKDARVIRRNQDAQHFLDMIAGDSMSPLDHIGFNYSRTVAAIVSGISFLLGLMSGFAVLCIATI